MLLIVAVSGVVTWFWHFRVAAEREQELAIRLLFESPDEWWDGPNNEIGDPISVVRSVNHLRLMGKQRAIAAMRSFAATHPQRAGTLNNVIPLLFNPPAENFEIYRFWHQHDIFVMDDLVHHGNFYRSGSGLGFQPKLLDWVEEHGEMRETPMLPPDNPFASVEETFRNLEQTNWGSTFIRDDRVAANGTLEMYFYSQIIQSTYQLSSTGKPFEFKWVISDDPQNRIKWDQYKSRLFNAGIYWDRNKSKYLTRSY